MTQPTPTRRALIGGAGLAAVALAAPALPAVTGPSAISLELARLIADHKRADSTLNAWYDSTWNPAIAAHNAAVDAIPHTEVATQGYGNVLGEDTPPHTYSTANKLDVKRCASILTYPTNWHSTDPRWQETKVAARRITIAAKWRERRIARLDRQWTAMGLLEQEDALWQPIQATTAAIIAFPIASAADLCAKLDHMHQIGTRESDGEEYEQIVRADAARLASIGAADMATSTQRIARRFLAIGGRFLITPSEGLDFGVDFGRILSHRTPDREQRNLLRIARAARDLIDHRPDEIAMLVRAFGAPQNGFVVWEGR